MQTDIKQCPVYKLNNSGPYAEGNREDIPLEKGIYFAFEFDKQKAEQGISDFLRLIYVGKASGDNTLRKRIGDHYTQHDLKYRGTENRVDMSVIAFFCCVMKEDDNVIADVEAAEIYEQQPPANTVGIDNYIGETAPLMVLILNEFKFVDKDLYKSLVIIRKDR